MDQLMKYIKKEIMPVMSAKLNTFEIYPVDNPSRVKVFDSTKHLIEKVGHSFMIQVHLYHLTQVGIH